MCSIMGYCGSSVTLDKFKKGFERTVSRGPDASRIIDTSALFLCSWSCFCSGEIFQRDALD